MTSVPADLQTFLAHHRDSRAYRRALAVKLSLQGYTYEMISSLLDVTVGFVSQAKTAYLSDGVTGLTLKYRGSPSFLTKEQRNEVLDWLKAQSHWSLQHLREHLEQCYEVVYAADQSYYDLLAAAEITYKKAQATNPKRNDERVAVKKKS